MGAREEFGMAVDAAEAERDRAVEVPAEVEMGVTFHLRKDLDPTALIRRARGWDRREGQEGRDYTIRQALVVVFHSEPEWLFTRPYDERVLDGWALDLPMEEWESWAIKDHQPGPAELAAEAETRSSNV